VPPPRLTRCLHLPTRLGPGPRHRVPGAKPSGTCRTLSSPVPIRDILGSPGHNVGLQP